VILPSEDGVSEAQPSFTPDGSHLVFERADTITGDAATWVMSNDGTDRREIGFGFGTAWSPAVSPDGTTISAAGWNLLEGDRAYEGLFTMAMDGSKARWITPSWPGIFPEYSWSPDGEWIVLSDQIAHANAPSNIVLVKADGSSASEPKRLTSFDGAGQRALTPSFSPDGQWIVFRLRDDDAFALYRIRTDGSDLERLTEPSESFIPFEVDWGPAGGG
jgi:Tol biopolymer transport system component